MTATPVLTESGHKKLLEELKYLEEVKRPELRDILEENIARGDITENEGYAIALEESQLNEKRIAEIKETLESAKIVSDTTDTHSVSIGNKVTVGNSEGKETVYQIVGDNETDPTNNMISSKSPIGSALIGHVVGDKVEVDLPKGKMVFTIKKIDN